MFKRLALAAIAAAAFCMPASSGAQNYITEKVATCDPATAVNCIKPNSDGSINVSGTISASNPSVGATGSATPTSGALISGDNAGTNRAFTVDASGRTTVNLNGLAQGSTTSGQTGLLTQCAVTTSAPSYTTAQTSPLSCDTAGNLRTAGGGGASSAFGSTFPANGTAIGAKNGANMIQVAADANGNVMVLPDAVIDGVAHGGDTQTSVAVGYSTVADGFSLSSFVVTAASGSSSILFETSNDNSHWTSSTWFKDTGFSFLAGFGAATTAVGNFYVPITAKYVRWSLGSCTGCSVTVVTVLKRNASVTIGAVTGNVASGTADFGDPVKTGGVYNSTNTSVSAGQRTDTQMTKWGAQIVRQDTVPDVAWNFAPASGGIVNTTTAVTMHAACGASLSNYLTDLQISADTLGGATEVAVRDGAAGTVVWRGKLQTAGSAGLPIHLHTPIKGTANTLLEVVTLTAVTGGVYVNGQGFCAP